MRAAILALLLAASALAQHWEGGALAGGGFQVRKASLPGASGAASVGFGNGPSFGAFLMQHLYKKVSGEIRYVYHRSDLRISGAAGKASMSGESQAVHYDWLFFTRPREARVRPYVAAGAGFKRYSGVGAEQVYQPLQDIALLTRTHEWKPLVTVAAGVKFDLTAKMCMRLEFRDYMTPFPKRVIVPVAAGADPGWVHELAPAITISFEF
jgi:opacity protein-like surface antigen